MLSGLLITLNILVCIALIAVVLLQRSEGGAFGVGGGPTGLITARGAGDLLTRTTWVLFGLFLALSMALTLLGAHDRATSSVIERLKLQQANPTLLNQKPAAPPPSAPLPSGPLTAAPAPSTAPLTAAPPPAAMAAPAPVAATPAPAHEHPAKHAAPKPSAQAAPAPVLDAPAPAAPASPTQP